MTSSPSSDSDRLSPAIVGCLDACHRCAVLVGAVREAEPAESRQASSAIGAHLRHCVDHLSCLLRGLESGVVDYDDRERDQALEIDPARMSERLSSLDAELRAVDSGSLAQSLRVRQSAASDTEPVTVESNLERELVFLSGHTIHHIAIMALLVRGQGISLPEGIDMAFSTAAHLTAVESD